LAASTMILTGLTAIANGEVNTAVTVDTNFDTVKTKFDAMLETATGHNHDGTNSRTTSAGIGSLGMTEVATLMIMGGFR
jgi:hypothetical protein